MTEVEFHTGVAEPAAFACKLLGKAYRSGARVLVTAPAARLLAIDRALWLAEERDFIPHARLPAAAAVLSRTPLWLVDDLARVGEAAVPSPTVLLNVGADAPAALQGLTRLIEVVGTEADERDAGRQRWRTYKAQGLAIKHHEAAV
jgi:DNA polymerase III subunit chi